MTPACRKVLRQYAAYKGVSMSDCLYLATKLLIHLEACSNWRVADILGRENVAIDTKYVEERLEEFLLERMAT